MPRPTAPPPPALARFRESLSHRSIHGSDLAYLDLGPRDGAPVVLVHGFPTSSWLYRDIAPRLADAGMRVVAPDLPGFGASAKPGTSTDLSSAGMAATLAALMDDLGFAGATFVVHDAGGPWTFAMAEKRPDLVAALVILNTTAYADLTVPPLQVRMLGTTLGRAVLAALASARSGRALVHQMFAGFSAQGRRLSRTATDGHWYPLHEGATRTVRAFARALPEFTAGFDAHARTLRALDVPATIIWAVGDQVLRHDRMVPRFSADLGVAAEDIHLVEGAGHFLQEDQPEQIADLVAGFVHSLTSGARGVGRGQEVTPPG